MSVRTLAKLPGLVLPVEDIVERLWMMLRLSVDVYVGGVALCLKMVDLD